MPATDRMPCLWSRRSLLVALAAGSAAALSGCRVRLQDGASHAAVLPARVPMKDERSLLDVLTRSVSLASLAEASGGAPTAAAARRTHPAHPGYPGQLWPLHVRQTAVITRVLRDGGVPESLIAKASAPTTARTPPPSTGVGPTKPGTALPAALPEAESDSLGDVSLADVAPDHVALLGSLLAQRRAAVTLLGARTAAVVPSGLVGHEAVRQLAAARAAVYGFEVVAAQIDTRGRALATSSLASLRARVLELDALAGAAATPPPLGYDLPFPVASPSSARRLALHLMDALLTSLGAVLEPAAGDGPALAALVQWLGATEVLAARWGAPLTAFPGLADG
jgi:hypothetical protein